MSAAVGSFDSVVTYFSKFLGIREAETNFLICQIAAFIYSCLFRRYLSPSTASPTSRHIAQITLGCLLAYMSFGWGLLHILVGGGVGFLMMRILDPSVVQYCVFVFAMLHLSWVHLYMLMRNAGVGNLDYIGPMMILTVKTSSLAYGIHDGFSRDEAKLNSLQKELVVRRYPDLLEYWSYIFCPQGLLVGPICYFSPYVDFIEGKKFFKKVKDKDGTERTVFDEPSSMRAVAKKLFITGSCVVVLLTLFRRFPIMGNISDEVMSRSFLYRWGYLLLSVEIAKSKYFFGWVWADAISNSAGLGFVGYDKNGQPDWSGVKNVDIIGFQFATSLKTLIDSWNMTCATWLKYVCYDRVPIQKRLLTFVLSAFWHGFYPGYFATFLSGSLLVSASARVRHLIRPHFLCSPHWKLFYDVVTWACTYVSLAYIITPFTYLHLEPTLQFFNSQYWWLHIVSALIMLILPLRRTTGKHKTTEKTEQNGLSLSQNGDSSTHPSIRDVVSETQSVAYSVAYVMLFAPRMRASHRKRCIALDKHTVPISDRPDANQLSKSSIISSS